MDAAQLVPLLLGAVATLSTALAYMYREESKRKSALIDRLLDAALRTTDVTDRTVTLAEKRERGTARR